MADVTDIQEALVALCAAALYPLGTSQPSVVGADCTVYAGWPLPARLDADLAAGAPVHVSVWARDEERITTRHLRQWLTVSQRPATLALTAAGQVLTLAGTTGADAQVLSATVNGLPHAVASQPGQTLAQLATALGSLIALDVPGTTTTGAAITLPAGAVIGALRVGAGGALLREQRRQERRFQVTVWAPTPALRTAAARALDDALEPLTFINLPDGSQGWMRYHASPQTDSLQKVALYRRDLIYLIDYAATQAAGATAVTQTELDARVADGAAIVRRN